MKNNIKQSIKKNQEKQSDSQSQFQQKQAFSIPDPQGSDVDPQQAEAFRYIMAVRQQATIIKQQNKNNIRENKKKMKLIEDERKAQEIKQLNKEENGSKTNDNKDQVDIDDQSQMLEEQCINKGSYVVDSPPIPKWLDLWIQQARNNWLCVIENMKHLHKNPQQLKPFIKKSSSEILSKIPQVHQICSLSVGRVESMLAQLSDQYYTNGGLYYYIWIYCLLAVHRSLSFHNIFQGIGSINSCLENQKNKTVSSLIVCCLLIKQFSQNHLWKIFSSNLSAIQIIQ